jgi:hypothetical protein
MDYQFHPSHGLFGGGAMCLYGFTHFYETKECKSHSTNYSPIIHEDEIFEKIKLTPMNVHEYIGYKIEFTSKKCVIVKRIISAAKSGKSIRIEYPYLKNGLVVGAGRVIYVIGK